MAAASTAVLGVIVLLAIAACGGDDGESANFEESVVGIAWSWESLEDEEGGAVMPPNPADYGVLFNEDGSVNIQADCNLASGTYEVEGEKLTIVLGSTTLAECGPESLYDLYLGLLADVASYSIDGGALILELSGDGRAMRFTESS